MVKEMYEGAGKSLELALKDLHRNSDGKKANLADVTFSVELLGTGGDLLGNAEGASYDQTFQGALQDAGIAPGDYSPRKHKLSVTAYAPAVLEKKAPAARASGSDGAKYSATNLTDLF